MKKWLLGLLLASLLSGCSGGSNPAQTADTITQSLAAQGLSGTLESAAQSHMQTLTGEPYTYTLDQDTSSIAVFVYDDTAAAQQDAACVSSDGFGYNRKDADGSGYGVQTEWAAPPHFYRVDNVILRYIGSDADVLSALEQVCGAPFAGDMTA